jgi:hypothetical protein
LLLTVEDVRAHTTIVSQAELVASDQVDGDVVLKQADVAAFAGFVDQGCFHGAAGGVSGM